MDKIKDVSDAFQSGLGSMYKSLITKATIAQNIEIGTKALDRDLLGSDKESTQCFIPFSAHDNTTSF